MDSHEEEGSETGGTQDR